MTSDALHLGCAVLWLVTNAVIVPFSTEVWVSWNNFFKYFKITWLTMRVTVMAHTQAQQRGFAVSPWFFMKVMRPAALICNEIYLSSIHAFQRSQFVKKLPSDFLHQHSIHIQLILFIHENALTKVPSSTDFSRPRMWIQGFIERRIHGLHCHASLHLLRTFSEKRNKQFVYYHVSAFEFWISSIQDTKPKLTGLQWFCQDVKLTPSCA
jgi:hypothetical protein